MEPNPYQAPTSEGPYQSENPAQLPADLFNVAMCQWGLIFCILAEWFLILLIVFDIYVTPAFVGLLLTGGFSSGLVSRFRRETSGSPLAVVYFILALCPVVGLLTLLWVNHLAVQHLRSHGVQVGPLGVKFSEIPRLFEASERESPNHR